MTVAPSTVEACCGTLYGNPLVELIAGESLHPGGLSTTRRLLAEARLPRGAHLLDAGCGLGASARLAALEFGLVVDACDVSGAALRRATVLAENAGAAIRFAEASVLRLPYADGSFGGVIAECVLSTTSKRPALQELRRVTAPGGTLLVSDVTASDAIVAPEPLASVLCLTQAWRPGELEDLVASTGYVVARSWDETASVSALIDRLEERIGLLAALARDHGLTGQLDHFGGGLVQLGDPARIASVFEEARGLVRDGRIGYRAVVARAASAIEAD